MFDEAILTRRVRGLENQQDSVMIGGLKQLLLRAEPGDMPDQTRGILALGFIGVFQTHRACLEADRRALRQVELL